MSLRIDPEKNEVRALKQVAKWRNRQVLEIGCGDGRLSWRLGRLGANVQAIDPNVDLIKTAREQTPRSLAARINFEVGTASKLKFSSESFDLVVFSWVL